MFIKENFGFVLLALFFFKFRSFGTTPSNNGNCLSVGTVIIIYLKLHVERLRKLTNTKNLFMAHHVVCGYKSGPDPLNWKIGRIRIRIRRSRPYRTGSIIHPSRAISMKVAVLLPFHLYFTSFPLLLDKPRRSRVPKGTALDFWFNFL